MSKFGAFDEEADAEMQEAAAEFDLPFGFLKATIAGESAGDWEKNRGVCTLHRPGGDRQLLPYIGVWEKTVERRGGDLEILGQNRRGQIFFFASYLRSLADRLDPWDAVSYRIHAGEGSPSDTYTRKIRQWRQHLDAAEAVE